MANNASTFSYSELAITIYPGDPGKFKVRATSDQGSLPQPAELELPVTAEQLPALLEELARAVLPQSETRDGRPAAANATAPTIKPREFGAKLYSALFRGDVQRLLDLTRGNVQASASRGLRIRLSFENSRDDMVHVMSLPWELLAESASADPISVSRRYPLVRALDVMMPATPAPFSPPFKVLVIVSSPTGVPPLDLEAEKANITKEWAGLPGVKVTWMRGVFEDVRRFLDQEDPHVLHFMGHGSFSDDQGVLLFETREGNTRAVSGAELGMLLKDEPSLRLVFLNACKTAMIGTSSAGGAFAGVATALVRAGVTAVLAMQFPISDRAAIVFSNTFYASLIDGQPVDGAVGEARKEVFAPMHAEWATPVLFMRSKDGALFDRSISSRTGTFAVPNAPPTTPPAIVNAVGAATVPLPTTTKPGDAAQSDIVQVAPPTTPTTKDFTVVMAAACDTVRADVKRASKLLTANGVTVVTIPDASLAASDAGTRVLAASADLFVHVFGEVAGEQVDDGPEGITYPMAQFRVAYHEARAQLVVMPGGLSAASVSDEAYRHFLKDEVESRPRDALRFEVATADNAEKLAAEVLRKRDALLAPPPAPQVTSVYLDVHQRDMVAGMPLQLMLATRGVMVTSMPSGDSPPREAVTFFEQSVRQAPLVLVLAGAVGGAWTLDRAKTAFKAGLDRTPEARVVIVRLPGSLPFATPPRFIDVIGDGVTLPEVEIIALLDEVSRSNA